MELPEGIRELELFASEPMVTNLPIMAIDAKGRNMGIEARN